MITITTPGTYFLSEYTYLARLIFKDWLGVEFTLAVGDQGKWTITSEGTSVSFPNIFFPEQSPETYLDSGRIQRLRLPHKLAGHDIVFPFADNSGTSLSSVDIFGSIFYFISCCEDALFPHNEFNGTLAPSESFACQNSMVDRPFIDEMLTIFALYMSNHNISSIKPINPG